MGFKNKDNEFVEGFCKALEDTWDGQVTVMPRWVWDSEDTAFARGYYEGFLRGTIYGQVPEGVVMNNGELH